MSPESPVKDTTEPDNVNVGLIATVTIVGALLVISIAAALTALVRAEAATQGDAVGAYANLGAISRLKDEQRKQLSSPPGWVDRAKGLVSLPIDHAEEIVTAEIRKNPALATPYPPEKPDAGREQSAAPPSSAEPEQTGELGAPGETPGVEQKEPAGKQPSGEASPTGQTAPPNQPAPARGAGTCERCYSGAHPDRARQSWASPDTRGTVRGTERCPMQLGRRLKRWWRAAPCLALMLSVDVAASAPVRPGEQMDRTEPLPKRLEGIDVVERLEGSVPKQAPFVSSEGRPVRLGDYLDGKVPVILTLNYSSCPMLCSLQLNALIKGLKQVDWTIGKEFRIVTVILDPKEPPARARETKARYVSEYGRPEAASGWHFLTGDEARIKEVARSVGISYGYNEKRDEYVHPAAIVMLTPEGRIARYLYGLEYHPKTVRLSLADVGEGKVGSTVDRIILYCFHYDEKEGRYAPVAMNIMRLGAGVGAVLLGVFLTTLWLAESRKKKKRAAVIGPAQSSET